MSEILKTEAVVLNKLNYGDSSLIVSLFTKDHGRFSAIAKGGRNPKSKLGMLLDPLNHVNIIFYNKQTRDVQLISSVDIINHYPKLKEDYELLKYGYSILELIKNLIPEHESHEKLFKGIIRIFELMNSKAEPGVVLFGRFFLFFLSEIGYEMQISRCVNCGKANLSGDYLSYNFELGILCGSCKEDFHESFKISAELFSYLLCLKNNKNPAGISNPVFNQAIFLMEKFLKHHINDFRGIQSLHLFK